MNQSIKLEEVLELTKSSNKLDWKEISDNVYSATIRHPNYQTLDIRIRKLGTGTAYTLSVLDNNEKISSWTGDVQPEMPEYSGNMFRTIYENAHRTFKRRQKTTLR